MTWRTYNVDIFLCCHCTSRYLFLSLHSGKQRFAQAWLNAIRRGPPFNVKTAKTCSKHFAEGYFLQIIASGRRVLRDNYVPSTFPYKNRQSNESHPNRVPAQWSPCSEIARPTAIPEQTASPEQLSGARSDTAEDQTSCEDAKNLGDDVENQSELSFHCHDSDQQNVIRQEIPTPSIKQDKIINELHQNLRTRIFFLEKEVELL